MLSVSSPRWPSNTSTGKSNLSSASLLSWRSLRTTSPRGFKDEWTAGSDQVQVGGRVTYQTIFLFAVDYNSSWRHKLRESDSRGLSLEIQASHMTSPSIWFQLVKERKVRLTSKSDPRNLALPSSSVATHSHGSCPYIIVAFMRGDRHRPEMKTSSVWVPTLLSQPPIY